MRHARACRAGAAWARHARDAPAGPTAAAVPAAVAARPAAGRAAPRCWCGGARGTGAAAGCGWFPAPTRGGRGERGHTAAHCRHQTRTVASSRGVRRRPFCDKGDMTNAECITHRPSTRPGEMGRKKKNTAWDGIKKAVTPDARGHCSCARCGKGPYGSFKAIEGKNVQERARGRGLDSSNQSNRAKTGQVIMCTARETRQRQGGNTPGVRVAVQTLRMSKCRENRTRDRDQRLAS